MCCHKEDQVTISRQKIYKTFMTPGYAWSWYYVVQFGDGKFNNHSARGKSLVEAKRFAKKKAKELGNIPVVIAWESK